MIEFKEYPWVVTSSFVDVEKSILHTWDPESHDFWHLIYEVFHNLIVLSVEPPPEARRELLWGDHASALTAAVCSASFPRCFPILWSQIKTKLSFPPVASNPLSHDHLSPQIYWRWPENLIQDYLCRTSQIIISLSFDPDAI